MRRLRYALVTVGLLAGCDASVKRTGSGTDEKSVHIAVDGKGDRDQVSLNLPGGDAKVSLPNIDLGRHMDLDGMRLAPGTRVAGIDIAGEEKGGNVSLRFTNPQAPAALLDYYRRAAGDAGYADVTAEGSALHATKERKTFLLQVDADGAGSRGTIRMMGAE